MGFYAPLWSPRFSGSSFYSSDNSHFLCTVTGALWTSLGRTFDRDNDYITMPQAVSQSLTGKDSATLLMWVKQTVIDGTAQSLFFIQNSSIGAARLFLSVAATTGVISGGGRSSDSGSAQSGNGSTLVVGGFHLVGMTMDLPNQTIDVWYDTTKTSTTGLAFAESTFQNTTRAGDVIGNNPGFTADFGGTIGEVLLSAPKLSDGVIEAWRYATKWRYGA